MKIIVLEVGRPIAADVEKQLGKPTRVVSYPRAVTENEYPAIIKEVYAAVRELAAGGEEVTLVLSGPLALSFQLGQVIGLSHWKITVYQFTGGRYMPAPPITRDKLF
ncbi:MAG: SAVED domain-containing protein [Thermoproteota archaeon]